MHRGRDSSLARTRQPGPPRQPRAATCLAGRQAATGREALLFDCPLPAGLPCPLQVPPASSRAHVPKPRRRVPCSRPLALRPRLPIPLSRFRVPLSWFPVPASGLRVSGLGFLPPAPCSPSPVPRSLFPVPGSLFPAPEPINLSIACSRVAHPARGVSILTGIDAPCARKGVTEAHCGPANAPLAQKIENVPKLPSPPQPRATFARPPAALRSPFRCAAGTPPGPGHV